MKHTPVARPVLAAALTVMLLTSAGTGCGRDAVTGKGRGATRGYQLAYVTPENDLVLADLGPDPLDGTRPPVITTLASNAGFEPAWSPDGRLLACVFVSPPRTKDPDTVKVFSPDDPANPLYELRCERGDRPRGVEWSPDGRLLAVDFGTSIVGSVQLLEVGSWREVGHLCHLCGFCWSPGGDRLAAGSPREVDPPLLHLETSESSDVVVYEVPGPRVTTLVEGTTEAMYWPLCWPEEERLLVQVVSTAAAGKAHVCEICPSDPSATLRRVEAVPLSCDHEATRRLLPPELRDGFSSTFRWTADESLVATPIKSGPDRMVWVVGRDGRSRRVGPGTYPAWRPMATPASH